MSIGTANAGSRCCGIYRRSKTFTYKFREGSVVYSIQKAEKGCLESVAIKSVKLTCGKNTCGQILYTDTFNGYWNEEELCTETDARNLAIDFLLLQQEAILEEMEKCR